MLLSIYIYLFILVDSKIAKTGRVLRTGNSTHVNVVTPTVNKQQKQPLFILSSFFGSIGMM